MGLFLGMSLVSVIELATFLWKITWIFISKKRREHMIAKKCRDEEREKHLQATMEFALQQRRFAASIGRLAASQQLQAESKGAKNFFYFMKIIFSIQSKLFSPFSAPIAKISFSNPLNYSSSSSFEYQQKQRKPSLFDTFFGLSKRKFSSFRKASKNNNFVDSIISNRVHGTTSSSSSEDENEDNEAKYCKKEKKSLGKLVELKINLNNLEQNGDRFRRKSTCLFNKQQNSNLWERRRATSIFEFCDNSTKINEIPKIIKEENF
ncbi:unnamed protein product [Meloidogyne enterolobii]|uniref:Uncharacterized protein n=1 Tax=Meloidogyne enterolobii TaxID=390850 RepID=A0ACB1AGV4_MELEN